MKTIKKVMTMVIASGVSVCSFGQINLGLQSTTQAAVNASVNAAVIPGVINAASQAATSATGTVVSKAGEIRTMASATARSTGNQALTTTRELTGTTEVNGAVALQANGQAGNNASVGVESVTNVHANNSTQTEKAGQVITSSLATAKEVKTTALAEINSAENAVKGTAGSVKPSAGVNASAGAASTVKANQQ